jgi:hypothetical protein
MTSNFHVQKWLVDTRSLWPVTATEPKAQMEEWKNKNEVRTAFPVDLAVTNSFQG